MLLGGINGTGTLTEIVGVVGDVRSERLSQKTEVELYRPFAQRASSFPVIALRGSGRPEMLLGAARAALDRVDRELPFIQPQTMTQVIRDSLGQERLTMSLLAAFAFLALLLALVGIYGAVAYTVEQRTGEIGVRMALGAQARDVLQLILSQGMQPVVIGLVVGLAVVLALGRLARLPALPDFRAQSRAARWDNNLARPGRDRRLSYPGATRHPRRSDYRASYRIQPYPDPICLTIC